MSKLSKIALIREMIDSAESSLRSAKQILAELLGTDSGASIRDGYARTAENLSADVGEEGKIVEGVFTGKSMIGPDQRDYPVPANYASKSKLVPGDVLKLVIGGDGGFVYKQIGPVERKRVVGTLTIEDSQFKVIAVGKAYKVLLASVTYYRAEAGDEVVLLVPAVGESEWGAIDNVIPKLQAELNAEDKFIRETKKAAAQAVNESEPEEEEESFIIGQEIPAEEGELPKKKPTRKKKED